MSKEHDPHWIPTWPILLRQEGTTHLDGLVHGYLASFRLNEKPAFPSQTRIAKALGVEPNSVRNSLKRLRDGGFVVAVPRKTETGRTTTNQYAALFPAEWGDVQAIASLGGDPPPTRRGPASQEAGDPPSTRRTRLDQSTRSPTTSSPAGDLDSCKQPYRSVAQEMRDEFESVTPGGKYKFTKADGSILKKIWEEVDDLAAVHRIFASAGLQAANDQFWASNWSVKFVYSQLSKLLNQGTTPGGIDESQRVASGVYDALVAICTLHGLAPGATRGLLRKHGIEPKVALVEWIRGLTGNLSRPHLREAFIADPAGTLERAIKQLPPAPGRASALRSHPGGFSTEDLI